MLQKLNRPVVKKALIGVGGFLVALGVLGGLVAPHFVRPMVEEVLTEKLHRPVKVAELSVNPYALSATVKGVSIGEKDESGELAGFDELYLNLQGASLLHLAPVVKEVRLAGPRVHLVRNRDKTYNVTDLIEEFLNKPDEESKAKYAVYNISVTGGRVVFEDRPLSARHEVSGLELGVPFVSNLPSEVEVFVQPSLKAKVDGAPLAFGGRVRPFTKDKVAEVDLDVADADLTRYFDYVPVPLAFKLASARLDMKLKLAFEQKDGKPAAMRLTGHSALRKLDMRHKNGGPILKLDTLKLALKSVEPLAGKLDLDSIALEGPDLAVRRLKDGSLSLAHLVEAAPAAAPKPAARNMVKAADKAADKPPVKATPLAVHLGEFRLTGGKLAFTDDMAAKPAAASLEGLEVKLTGLALEGGEPRGKSELALSLKSVQVGSVGEKQPLLALESLALSGAVEADRREVALAEVKAVGGRLLAVRETDGSFSFEKFLPPASPAIAAAPVRKPAVKAAVPAGKSPAWTVSVKKLALEGWGARLDDRMTAGSLPVEVRNLGLTADNLSTAKGAKAGVALKADVGKKGGLSASGSVALAPLAGNLALELKSLDLVPLQAYFLEHLNVTLSRGSLGGKAGVSFEVPAVAGQAMKAGVKGNLALADLTLVDKGNATDLLKWKSLSLSGISAALGGKLPLDLSLSEIALRDFYARLIVNSDRSLALRKLVKREDGAAPAGAAGKKAPDAPASEMVAEAPAAKADPGPAPYRVKVGKVSFRNGRVNFSDFFIKPNYSANLTDMGGSITGLSSEPGTTATVDLSGTVDGTAPLSISGRTNPLSRDLFLDLAASAKGVELAGLSPYAARYAGYAIEKGKLSVDIRYFIENRQLKAENHVFLDQLTFGQKVDSPDATKLPVMLAVALLKNSRGEIDINLPIGGSLDDPQFSVGGIVVKVIMNLVVKAVTAPFALLGNLFGGGEELGWLEFDPGRAAIGKAGEDKLAKLAKALADRPGLKLEVSGRIDPEADRAGWKLASLERRMKALKLKDSVGKGEEGGSLEEITLGAAERAKYLARVYKDESFKKPRNMIGLAKDLPPEEMEKLILENTQVSDEALQRLASQRAKSVADWMVRQGKVPAERVFLVAANKDSPAKDDARAKAKLSRVDFSLR